MQGLKKFEIMEGCRMCYGDGCSTTDEVQRTACVRTMGGVVKDGGEGKMRYNSGSRKYVLVWEGMGV